MNPMKSHIPPDVLVRQIAYNQLPLDHTPTATQGRIRAVLLGIVVVFVLFGTGYVVLPLFPVLKARIAELEK